MAKSKKITEGFQLQSVKTLQTEFNYEECIKQTFNTYAPNLSPEHLEFIQLYKEFLMKRKDSPETLRVATNAAREVMWRFSPENYFRSVELEIEKDRVTHEQKFKETVVGNLVLVKKTGMHGLFQSPSRFGTKTLKLLHRNDEIVDIGEKEIVVIGTNLFEFYVALTGYTQSEKHLNPYKCIEAVNSHSELRSKIETLTNDYKMPVKEVVKVITPFVLKCLQGV